MPKESSEVSARSQATGHPMSRGASHGKETGGFSAASGGVEHPPHDCVSRLEAISEAAQFPLCDQQAVFVHSYEDLQRELQLSQAHSRKMEEAVRALEERIRVSEQEGRNQIEFQALVVHELRNPLAPLLSAAALLASPRGDETELLRVRAIIERQVAHLSRLLDDLLDVSRVRTGKLSLQKRMVDLALVIEESVQACSPDLDRRMQYLSLKLPGQAMHVYGDSMRLSQVLRNLLTNASKYTQFGGEISVSADVVENSIVINVLDSGIGISADALPRIFEPFVQAVQANEYADEGLGIGLTIVRELVQAHRGSVSASSSGRGLGSEFVIRLPLARPGEASSVHPG